MTNNDIAPTVGKFWMPEKPKRIRSSRNISKLQNGSVPLTPERAGVDLVRGIASLAIIPPMASMLRAVQTLCAGIDPSERVVRNMAAFVSRGMRISRSLSREE